MATDTQQNSSTKQSKPDIEEGVDGRKIARQINSRLQIHLPEYIEEELTNLEVFEPETETDEGTAVAVTSEGLGIEIYHETGDFKLFYIENPSGPLPDELDYTDEKHHHLWEEGYDVGSLMIFKEVWEHLPDKLTKKEEL